MKIQFNIFFKKSWW